MGIKQKVEMKMKKMICSLLCVLCLLTAICTPACAAQTAVVNNPDPTDRLNLRTKPSESAVTLGKYYNGVTVTVYRVTDGWAKVDVQGREGYMKDEFLAYGDAANAVKRAVPTMTVGVESLHLRADASTRSESLGAYGYGTPVEILGVGTVWHHVAVGRQTGYMKAEYLCGDVSFHKKSADARADSHAVVANPRKEDRLNLREQPKTTSASLGKFYNGTAVRVIEKRADGWCKVEIGVEGSGVASGYMQTRYLAFGEAIKKVTPAVKAYHGSDGTIIEGIPGGEDDCILEIHQGDILYVLGDVSEEVCFVMTQQATGYYSRWALSQ